MTSWGPPGISSSISSDLRTIGRSPEMNHLYQVVLFLFNFCSKLLLFSLPDLNIGSIILIIEPKAV